VNIGLHIYRGSFVLFFTAICRIQYLTCLAECQSEIPSNYTRWSTHNITLAQMDFGDLQITLLQNTRIGAPEARRG